MKNAWSLENMILSTAKGTTNNIPRQIYIATTFRSTYTLGSLAEPTKSEEIAIIRTILK